MIVRRIHVEGMKMNSQEQIIGSSQAIDSVRQLLECAANSDANVLICGQTGAGKATLAKYIHMQSTRHHYPFVPINCSAITSDLLDVELFGHEKGAFQGAITERQGRVELSQFGTLFLDEIGDMPLAIQMKLLRVLEEKSFERIGSNKSLAIDTRIIAATHHNLEDKIAQGDFREDLYYRLKVFPIHMPPLCERPEDIPLLINQLISKKEAEGHATIRILSSALQALCQYQWPGNIRELENLIERLMILYPNGVIEATDLPKRYQLMQTSPQFSELATVTDITSVTKHIRHFPSDGINLKEHLVKTELALIAQALEESNWIVAKAAKYLKMRRTTLVEKMRKYHISRPNKSNKGIAL